MSQVKEQDKTPEKQLSKVDIHNLLEKQLRVDLLLGFFESFRVTWIRLECVKIAVETYHFQRLIGGKTLSFK